MQNLHINVIRALFLEEFAYLCKQLKATYFEGKKVFSM